MGFSCYQQGAVRRTGDTMSGSLGITSASGEVLIDDGGDTLSIRAAPSRLTSNTGSISFLHTGGEAGIISFERTAADQVEIKIGAVSAAANADDNSIYIDSLTGLLSFKDSGGVVHTLL